MPKGNKPIIYNGGEIRWGKCPHCEWKCVRKISEKFRNKLIITHAKLAHGIILTQKDLKNRSLEEDTDIQKEEVGKNLFKIVENDMKSHILNK